MYISMCMSIHTHMHMKRYICVHVYLYIYIYVYTYTCISLSLYVCKYPTIPEIRTEQNSMEHKLNQGHAYLSLLMYKYIPLFIKKIIDISRTQSEASRYH